MEELTTYALLDASVVDAVQNVSPRSPLQVSIIGVGTPPEPVDPGLLWARAVNGQFVVVADATAIPLDSAASSTPPPQHVSAAFPLHLRLDALGYTSLDVVVNVASGSAIPIKPGPYALSPLAVALRGRVMLQGAPPAPILGATVSVTATVPAAPLPAPVTTDANGFYVFIALPLVQSLTLDATSGAHNGTQSVMLDYSAPANVANFLLN